MQLADDLVAMTNPFNPLNWLRSAQDWFAKTERSSGFRPYLIFFLLVSGLSVVILSMFGEVQAARETALVMLKAATFGFIALFAVKAFQDPDFCRSETHVQRLYKLELESMGTESDILPAEIVEEALAEADPEETSLFAPPSDDLRAMP